MSDDWKTYKATGETHRQIEQSLSTLVETHKKCCRADGDDGRITSFFLRAQDGDENRQPWLILVGRYNVMAKHASETAIDVGARLIAELESMEESESEEG